jgi:amidase
VRLGVVRSEPDDEHDPDDPDDPGCHEQALAALVRAGAHLVDVTLPTLGHDDEMFVLRYEFAPGVANYLASFGPDAPVRSLADIQAWNREHADVALKFGQIHVDAAVAIDHVQEAEAYRRARERDLKIVTSTMEAALGDDLEALVFPRARGCSWAARAGWPSIVLPAGYAARNRRPVGVMLVARAWTDDRLLQLAYAFEHAHPVRRAPAEINPAMYRGR